MDPKNPKVNIDKDEVKVGWWNKGKFKRWEITEEEEGEGEEEQQEEEEDEGDS